MHYNGLYYVFSRRLAISMVQTVFQEKATLNSDFVGGVAIGASSSATEACWNVFFNWLGWT